MRASLLILLVVLGADASAFAQSLPTATLYGRVTDPSRAAMVGATVELRGTTLIGGATVATTSDRGEYRFVGLPPGEYELTARAVDFAVWRQQLQMPIGVTVRLDASLSLAPIAQATLVRASPPIIDISRPSMSTYVGTDFLLNLPSHRALGEILNLAAGVVRNFEAGGAAFGGTVSSNLIAVEGIDVTDPKRQRVQVGVNQNWIQEAEVAALGAGAEFGDFTGAVANIALRSGANRLGGLGEYWTTRQRWVDDNTETGTTAPRIDVLWDVNLQTGGPIVRDRLWYFGGYEYFRRDDRPTGYQGEDVTSVHNGQGLVRLTGALARPYRFDAMWRRQQSRKAGDGIGPFTPLEVTSLSFSDDDLVHVGATWAGRAAFVQWHAGGFRRDSGSDPTPPATRSGPPSVFESTTRITSGNARQFSSAAISRWNTELKATRALDRTAWGSHEFSGGLRYERTSALEENGFPGNLRISTTNSVPTAANGLDGSSTSEAWGHQAAAYAQDHWRLSDRITLELGVRAEFNRSGIPDGPAILATNPLAPRLGVAWAVTSDNRTAIKAHYGRYFDALLTNRVAFMDIARQQRTVFYGFDSAGNMIETGRSAPLTARSIDPDIRHSYVDQYVVGAERQIGAHLLATARYVHRDFEQFMGMTDTGSLWAPTTIIDPGNDDIVGTADDLGPIDAFRQLNPGNNFYYYTNPDDAFRNYDALQFIGSRKYSNDANLEVSYTWSRNRGTVGNQDFVNAGQNDLGEQPSPNGVGVFMNPNALINADGRASNDLSEFKALGTYHGRWLGGFVVGAALRWETGARYGRILNVPPGTLSANEFISIRTEPRGTRELPAVINLDLRVSKTLAFHQRQALELVADGFNMTNQGTPTAVFPANGGSFGFILNRADPRNLRIALRYQF